jgi:phytoene synthase
MCRKVPGAILRIRWEMCRKVPGAICGKAVDRGLPRFALVRIVPYFPGCDGVTFPSLRLPGTMDCFIPTMSTGTELIEASRHACRRLTRAAGSNFSTAFLLLPAVKRQAMDALYAFMRHSDDLADEPPLGGNPGDALRRWRDALLKAIGGQFETPPAGVDPRGGAILPAVVQTVRDFHIPVESFLAVLDGVEMDLTARVYNTFEELTLYCERVASAVGLACMYVWGFEGAAALPCGRSAGIALQLTNILRDLGEDARRGRIYLPQEDLTACGYTVQELHGGVVNDAFLRLMGLEIERAEGFYRAAAELPRWLHKDGRRIYGLMMDRYHALLDIIRRQPGDVFSRRVRLGGWKKACLAAKWMLGPAGIKDCKLRIE